MMNKAMVLLSIVAFIFSCILCYHALTSQGLVGCSAGSSCNQVLTSRWSFLFARIPVSGLAMLCYSILTVCLLCRHSFKDDPKFALWMDLGMQIMAGAILGAAVWFIWLQQNMIRAFCPYCMTLHICGILLAVLLLISIRQHPFKRMLSLLAGLSLAGCLAAIQLFTTPRTAYDRGFIPEELPMPQVQEMPVVGNPSAPKIITLLYDYRCSHCQKIHALLPHVVEELNGQVAFLTAPVPLSKECNPYTVLAGEDRFKGSCELTRYALALWRCNQKAFAAFDEWLFESENVTGWYPREPEEAFAKACSLVGESTLNEALADPWIDNYLTRIFELFGRTSSSSKSAIPRFISNEEWLVPDVDNVKGLAELIRKNFP